MKEVKRQPTPFEKLVYSAVQKIPKGEVRSYEWVARKIGRPKSARAVGNALNKNRSKEVPCHRVVRKDGEVGGFYLGTDEKIRILQREKSFAGKK